MRNTIPLAFAVLLAGCYDGEPSQVGGDDAEVSAEEWKSLPDGSRAYFSARSGQHSGARDVEHCWPVDGAWDCLGAFQLMGGAEENTSTLPVELNMEPGASSFFASRATKKRLEDPFPHSDEDNPQGGYRCYTSGGGILNETIYAGEGEGTTLISNDVAPYEANGGSAWTEGFVTNFLEENEIPPDRPYWSCEHIESLIASGSLEALATTALTYDGMTGAASDSSR